MTYPEKIAYLYRYRDALRREKTIADEIEALRAEAARVTQALTGMPGGGMQVRRLPVVPVSGTP